jgi:hypothetical protein
MSTTEPTSKLGGKVLALEYLTRARKPMPVKELVAKVLADSRCKLAGRTPEATLSAALYVECAKSDGVIMKYDKGIVDLRSRQQPAAPKKRRAKAEPEPEPTA